MRDNLVLKGIKIKGYNSRIKNIIKEVFFMIKESDNIIIPYIEGDGIVPNDKS